MTQLFIEDGIGFVSLVDSMKENALLKSVNAARISYNKRKEELDDKDLRLIDFLKEHGHWSPFRHSYFTFHIKAPLFTFRQALKHQVGCAWRTYEVDGNDQGISVEAYDLFYDTDKGCSANEISGRYVTFKDPEFYVPLKMRTNPAHGNKQASIDLNDDFDHEAVREEMLDECANLYEAYRRWVDIGIAKEIARMPLPQNLYTEMYWTVSLQAVLHFLDQRLKPDAQYEIRMYAQLIEQLVNQELEA